MKSWIFEEWCRTRKEPFFPLIPVDLQCDKLLYMDMTAANQVLTAEVVADTAQFSAYITQSLENAGARYGIGGYDEHRTVYQRSQVFDTGEEPRRLHLGLDIWGPADTPVFAPMNGTVHSFAFNDAFGDYGATIILEHAIQEDRFYSLYGHLSLKDIESLQVGASISAGEVLAHFGEPHENGHWPPHLHFQLILDMEGKLGDYPGVCKFSERERYLQNCPDPDLFFHWMSLAIRS